MELDKKKKLINNGSIQGCEFKAGVYEVSQNRIVRLKTVEYSVEVCPFKFNSKTGPVSDFLMVKSAKFQHSQNLKVPLYFG